MSVKPNKHVLKLQSDPFDLIRVFVPKSILKILREKSKEMGLPMSRLVAYAIDKEIESKSAFEYPCKLPDNEFIDYAHADEASRLAQYLTKFLSGAGRDMLMLCRRDFGIDDKHEFMEAYRQLLNSGVIHEVNPPGRAKFKYHADYQYTQLKKIVNEDKMKKKRRLFEKLKKELGEDE